VNATSTASIVRLRARITPASAASTSSTCHRRTTPGVRVPAREGASHSRGSFEATIPANRTGSSRG
jgi:hypothetical protein